MEVTKYVFQSPYPSSVQVGRPDPQAKTDDNAQQAVDSFSKVDKKTSESSVEFVGQVSSGTSVNVAVSSTDPALSSSLETFSSLNTQVQGLEAYTS